MGGDKAMRELNGRPLVAHVADALAGVCDRVVVVAGGRTVADGTVPGLLAQTGLELGANGVPDFLVVT